MAYNSLFSKTPATYADEYAFTMGSADHSAGDWDRISTSQVFFRDLVNNGFRSAEGKDLKIPYLVVAGIGPFFEWLSNWKFTDEDIAEMAKERVAGTDKPLFRPEYLERLKTERIRVDIDAIPEGELAFPDEPIMRITGPHWQVEMLEAAALQAITAQTVWATIASQFWLAAQRLTKNAKLYEFGARRNPEWGGLGAARSAYLAGWDATSNRYARHTYGIPSFGTMAHAFIMVRESEVKAFADWAKNMPYLGIFLPDTYNTEEGIKNAIAVCKEQGVKLRGIRLDSGDTDYLSRKAREMLNEAGFRDATIIASDGHTIGSVHHLYQVKEAPIDAFAIGGAYVNKRQDGGLAAVLKVARADGRDVMKFSETPEKSTIPGVLDVVRFLEPQSNGGYHYAGDVIVPLGADIGDGQLAREVLSIPRNNPVAGKPFPKGAKFFRPIVPHMQAGKPLLPNYVKEDAPAILRDARKQFFKSMNSLDSSHKEIISPRLYGVGLEEGLHDDRAHRIRENRTAPQRAKQEKRFGGAVLQVQGMS